MELSDFEIYRLKDDELFTCKSLSQNSRYSDDGIFIENFHSCLSTIDQPEHYCRHHQM